MANSWPGVREQSAGVFCVDGDAGSGPATDPYRRGIKAALFAGGSSAILEVGWRLGGVGGGLTLPRDMSAGGGSLPQQRGSRQ